MTIYYTTVKMNYEKAPYPFPIEDPTTVPLWTIKIPINKSRMDNAELLTWTEDYIVMSSNKTLASQMKNLDIDVAVAPQKIKTFKKKTPTSK